MTTNKLFIFFILLLSVDALLAQPLQYENIGPSRGGRVTAVAGVETAPNVFYMGATGGGLWKSENFGASWRNISDGYFSTPSIGAIAVYQQNPDIIYVGTGSDGIRSNVIVGKGVYKSTDAGSTWSFVGLKDAGQIGTVLIHPENPELVYVAAIGHPFKKSKERGVYRSKDGGENWENILFLSDSVGALDMEFAPNNPQMLYVSMWRGERKPWTIISGGAEDGIFKSTDGGDTWERKSEGLPTGLTGKIDFAVSAQKPERAWALIQADGGQQGLYLSDDYAESWTQVEMPPATHKSIMYRPFYFTNLDANPKNADNIWAGTKVFWTTYDAGKTWKQIPSTHADHHDLWINPMDTTIMIEGNDGGAAVSRDGGQQWSTVFNQPTAELYSCHVDDQYPYYVYSGQQDNSTIRVPSAQPYLDVLNSNDNHNMNDMMYWEDCGGCETGPVIPKPGNPDVIYANCKGQFSVYYRSAGVEQRYYIGAESLYSNHPDSITYRFQRVTPMEVSPHNPDVVYYGSQFLHKTDNGGQTWSQISPDLTANEVQYRMRSGGPIDEDISGEEYYGVLYAIRESPLKAGVIWTGSNDGLFHVTQDGGQTWANITPDMPGGGRVSNIEVSPFDPARAYYAVYRDYLGDDTPYLYATKDYGKSWKLLTNGIPADYPVRVVREDPNREGLLYAGTEFGLFVSFNAGIDWQSFQRNLPIVPVTDIRIHRGDLVLSTLGRSFWVMRDISPLWTLDLNQKRKAPVLYKPRNTVGGVSKIQFSLPAKVKDTIVHFEFKKDGQLVHAKDENLSLLEPDEWGIRTTEWDLKHYLSNGEKDFAGPKVSPGKIDVTMEIGGKKATQSFNYSINPNLQEIGVTESDLAEQEELGLKVARLVVDIEQHIAALQRDLKEAKGTEDVKSIKAEISKFKKGPKRYDEPQILEHTKYLYTMITRADQKPGEDAYVRYENLKKDFEKMMK
ncbi:MAG: hypothetical protein ABJN36_00070 [Cyclobacteriaceae bacterium]